jgi:hypothetical protein
MNGTASQGLAALTIGSGNPGAQLATCLTGDAFSSELCVASVARSVRHSFVLCEAHHKKSSQKSPIVPIWELCERFPLRNQNADEGLCVVFHITDTTRKMWKLDVF